VAQRAEGSHPIQQRTGMRASRRRRVQHHEARGTRTDGLMRRPGREKPPWPVARQLFDQRCGSSNGELKSGKGHPGNL
jgi:hypothetical protein